MTTTTTTTTTTTKCVVCQLWLTELIEVGFSGHRAARRDLAVSSTSQLTDLLSRVIFTLTAGHSATHVDATDLYGFIPEVPAMMRRAPPTSRDGLRVTHHELRATLPDQFPDAYYVALAFVIQVHKPDEVTTTICHCGSCSCCYCCWCTCCCRTYGWSCCQFSDS